MNNREKKVKAWLIFDNHFKTMIAYCSEPFEIYRRQSDAQKKTRLFNKILRKNYSKLRMRVVPCTITYNLPEEGA